MSRNQKIVVFIASLVLLSCCACGLITFVVIPRLYENTIAGAADPAKAKEVAKQIADYTLPPTYQETVGMDVLVYKMVVIARADKQGFIITLMQFNSSNVSREEIEQQLRSQSQLQGNISSMQLVGAENTTIKGQTVTLNVLEGDGSRNSNVRIRQTQGVFQGKNGLVVLMVMGGKTGWDDGLMREFLSSIR